MQRKLTLQIARQVGLPILSMEHHDCLLFGGGDLVKMFVPRAKRVMGGSPQDRMVTGHLLIVPKDNLQPLTPRSRRRRIIGAFRSIHLANFPSIIPLSQIRDDGVAEPFLAYLLALADTLPSDETGWRQLFGKSFIDDWQTDSSQAEIQYLRKDSRFAFEPEAIVSGLEISIKFEPAFGPSS